MKDFSIKVIDLQQYSIKSEKASFPKEHSFFFDEWKKKEKKRPAFLSRDLVHRPEV